MPHLPLHKCNYAGCIQYVSEKYCEKHKHEMQIIEDKRMKAYFNKYDKEYYKERGSSTERGYNVRWRTASKMYLREHPLCECEDCIREGKRKTANAVHHIVAHHGNYDLFWDESNWMAINKECHDRLTWAENKKSSIYYPSMIKKPRIPMTVVCGAPGSGKSTYVLQHKGLNDYVIDTDEIIAELSGLPIHQAPMKEWIEQATIERNHRINNIPSNYDNAWLITTSAKKWQRDYWRDRCKAKVIVIETNECECIRRVNKDITRRQDDISRESLYIGIRQWWKNYERSNDDYVIKDKWK